MVSTGLRLLAFCWVGLGIVACSAAGESSSSGNQPGAPPKLQLNPDTTWVGEEDPPSTEEPPVDVTGDGGDAVPGDTHTNTNNDPDAGAPGSGQCDCEVEVPGVEIEQDGAIIDVALALPNEGMVVIEVKTGSVTTSASGVDIQGDVLVDLGAEHDVSLLDAKLHVGGEHAGGPILAGQAMVEGSLLEGLGGNVEDSPLSARVSLELPSADHSRSQENPAIGLDLSLPSVTLDTSALPAAANALTWADAKLHVTTDGASTLLRVDGKLQEGVDAWNPMVPLVAPAALTASATLVDGAPTSVTLVGDVKLDGEALSSGSLLLRSLELPEAIVTLDPSGASLSASTTVSLLPGYALTGEARIDGHFTRENWSINVCGGVMTNLLGGAHDAVTCLDLGKGGMTPCLLPTH